MDRDQFIEQQAALLDRAFSLTSGEETLRARFETMALETYEHLTRAKAFAYPFIINPESAGNFLRQGEKTRTIIPPALLQQWLDWEKEYPRLLGRNPRLEFHHLLHWIGETDNASSWPFGLEPSIQRWIDNGERTPTPFDDRYNIITPEFYERLREVRRKAAGMLYWDDDKRQVCFADDAEWPHVMAGKERRRQEFERRMWEVQELAFRKQEKLPEVLAAAREDTAFWEALKAWELAREGRRPTQIPPPASPGAISGPIRTYMVAPSPEERTKHDNPPVDPLLAKFIVTYREYEDALTVFEMVLYLRVEVRRELGLDPHLLGWPGGPGLGVST